MGLVLENRASFILYNIIRSNKLHKGVMLLPANICPIVPAILFKTGVHFEFVDIQSDNFFLDCDSILQKIKQSDNIRSLLVHSTFGFDYDFEGLFSDLRSINRDIFIINDRCLNIPSVTPGTTSADVILSSTGYSKYVDFSFGGFAFIADNVNYDRNTIHFNANDHDKLVNSFEHSLFEKTQFINPDTDWLDGSHLILKKSEYFDKIVKRVRTIADQKKKINNIYYENLKSGIILGKGYNSWRFNILVNNKKRF